jgi:hypothetical protein
MYWRSAAFVYCAMASGPPLSAASTSFSARRRSMSRWILKSVPHCSSFSFALPPSQ